MPTISIFFGITIRMFFVEHPPPHFHASYQRHRALISIETGDIIHGSLPPGTYRVVREWTRRHRAELMENWNRARERVCPFNAFRERISMNESEFPYEFVDVVGAEPRGAYRLMVRFSNGEEGERDFADLIAEGGPMVEPLRDPTFFARVFIDDGILTWPNGFDLDSIALHDDMKKTGQLHRPAA